MLLQDTLEAYQDNPESEYAEDRLRIAVKETKPGTSLTIAAHTYSYATQQYITNILKAIKTNDSWVIERHWFHRQNTKLNDDRIADDLLWALRIRNSEIYCTEPEST